MNEQLSNTLMILLLGSFCIVLCSIYLWLVEEGLYSMKLDKIVWPLMIIVSIIMILYCSRLVHLCQLCKKKRLIKEEHRARGDWVYFYNNGDYSWKKDGVEHLMRDGREIKRRKL